ncbi:pinin-like [Asterias rubens]|uniref:pinin-like n=1 Tax=Asterias rubens TaxID=7604 RepID=UPI0014554E25|nr:pinin-like [Asterias rubens]
MAYVSALQGRLEKAKESLQNVDENIRKLTGREPGERRIPAGAADRGRDGDQRRVSVGGQGQRGRGRGGGVQRGDAFQRLGLPLQRRQSTGSAFSRLGGRVDGPRLGGRVDGGPRLGGRVDGPRLGGRVDGPRSRVDGPQPKRLRRKQNDDDDDLPKHTIQSSVVATPIIERTRQDSIKEQSKNEEGQKRNRRMFGHLLGTLQKFKQESNDSESKESRRVEIEHKLDVQAQEEKQAVAHERTQLFIKRSNQQQELQKLEKLVDMAKEQDVWDAHSKRLSQYIRTKSKPAIFYRPAKPSLVTEKRLKDTKELMNEMMKKRRAEIEEEIQQLQDDAEEHDGKEMEHDGKESSEVKGKTKEKKRRHSSMGKHEEGEQRNGKHSKKRPVSDDGELPTSEQQDTDDDYSKETSKDNKKADISMEAEQEWVVKEGSAGKDGEGKQTTSSSEEGEVDRTMTESAGPEESGDADEGKENIDEKEKEDFRSALYKEEFDQRNELSWEGDV